MKKVILVLAVLAFARGESFSENKKDCESNGVIACSLYGEDYLFGTYSTYGDSVRRDYIKAKFFLEKACKVNIGKYDEYSAKKACFYLGFMYLEGLGVEKDDKKAFELFNTAYDGKSELVYNRLGNIYFHGRDKYSRVEVREDREKGVDYLEESCNGGYWYACKDLGDLHYGYYGDMSEAIQYYKKTCELGKNDPGVKKDDSKLPKSLQEACDMYELLK